MFQQRLHDLRMQTEPLGRLGGRILAWEFWGFEPFGA